MLVMDREPSSPPGEPVVDSLADEWLLSQPERRAGPGAPMSDRCYCEPSFSGALRVTAISLERCAWTSGGLHGRAPVNERGGLPRASTSQSRSLLTPPPAWSERLPRARLSPTLHSRRRLADLMPNTLPARRNIDAVRRGQVGQPHAQRPLDLDYRKPKPARQFRLAYSCCFPTTASRRRS